MHATRQRAAGLSARFLQSPLHPMSRASSRAVLQSVAVLEIGTAKVRHLAGVDEDLSALIRMDGAASDITDDEGRPLERAELPVSAVVAGETYPARELVVHQRGRLSRVVVTVARGHDPGGARSDVAFLTVERRPEVAAGSFDRETFFDVAAHELRSPLASLSLDLERLRRRVSATGVVSPHDVARDLERVQRQATRLTLLVQNLLDASHMRSNRFSLAAEESDLCAVVAETMDMLHSQVEAAGCVLFVAPCEAIVGLWDRGRLGQVLHNLVSNAVKHGGSGKSIHVRVQREGATARLEVCDEGPGVALADRHRIFEPFQRGRNAGDAAATHSMGLGLYIVREIVAAHGGTVHVEPHAEHGSRFVVQLPIRSGHED